MTWKLYLDRQALASIRFLVQQGAALRHPQFDHGAAVFAATFVLVPIVPEGGWGEGTRGSEFYQRYIDKITTIATSNAPTPDVERKIEYVIRQFYAETVPMSRAPFRKLREDLAADLEGRASSYAVGP